MFYLPSYLFALPHSHSRQTVVDPLVGVSANTRASEWSVSLQRANRLYTQDHSKRRCSEPVQRYVPPPHEVRCSLDFELQSMELTTFLIYTTFQVCCRRCWVEALSLPHALEGTTTRATSFPTAHGTWRMDRVDTNTISTNSRCPKFS